MDELIHFHFIRPLWLLCIPALLLLGLWLRRQHSQHTGFEQWIDKNLLSYISNGQQTPSSSLPYIGLIILWIISSIALAGPTWKQLPQPLHESEKALVVILDLSNSMNAQDNKPSRIVRARLKIQDLLSQRKEGLTALVVYAGEAYVVTPLTDDTRTIINLLSTLKPGLLPIPGSNIEMAVDTSKQLVADSGLTQASFVIVTDGIAAPATDYLKKTYSPSGEFFILGVGTRKGAPIPVSDGWMTDNNNQTITAIRDDKQLQAAADSVNGHYLTMQANDADIQFLRRALDKPIKQSRELDRNIDQWYEWGPTLLLILLPFSALLFRRGWIVMAIITVTPALSLTPQYTQASSENNAINSLWNNAWSNSNQRGQQAFDQQDYQTATDTFRHYQWKGSAAYRNKDYRGAINAFEQGNTANDHYNRGNAHAKLGEFDKAISAYKQALALEPSLKDAQENKELVEALKEKQQNPSSDDDGQNDGNDNQDQQQDSDKQDGDSQDNNSQQNNGEQTANSNDGPTSSDPTDNQGLPENEEPPEDEKSPVDTATPNNEEPAEDKETPTTLSAFDALNSEEKQALEQWIKKIPDDPSGLLKRKFKYEFQQRRRAYQKGEWELPNNDAHHRY